MKERPILFSGPMVRAILEGRKTQTRRVVKLNASGRAFRAGRNWHLGDPECVKACPYGQPGDRLWVRETWRLHDDEESGVVTLKYRADDAHRFLPGGVFIDPGWAYGGWKPSIHMPRWACRIVLEITGVRVERLQHMDGEDARAEGVSFHADFRELWDSLASPGARWNDNPCVWVVEFKRAEVA